MNRLFHICMFALLINVAWLNTATGQQPVYTIRITVQIAPPYPPYLDDYKNKAIVSFTNLSQTPADIYLRGKVSNDRGEFIQTKPNIFTLIPIHVPGLQTVVLQGSQVDGSYLDLNNLQTNLSNTEYANLFQLGLMPEGFYTFCLYAYTRNANGNYIPVSDPQAGSTCSMFNVGYVVPPTIINPLDQSNTTPTPNQNLLVSWTRPAGNLQGANLVYDLYIVKVIQGEDPNTATNASVQYGAGIFYKQANIIGPGFQFSNLTGFPLEDGNTYALMVQAKDLNGKTAFENNGMSAVVTMTYGAAAPTVQPMKVLSLLTPTCPCKIDVSSLDPTNANQSLLAGQSFTMNNLTIKTSSIGPANADGSVNGLGSVSIKGLPVLIQFQNVIVNPDHIAIAGTVTGSSTPDLSSLLGGTGPPSLTTDNFQSFVDRIRQYNVNQPLNTVGVPLPVGLNDFGAPDEANLAITALSITPDQSTYDAVAVVKLIDAQSVLVLGASDVCFSSSSLFCKSAYFHLLQDFQVPQISLTIKAQNGADSGTYAIDDNGTITTFNLEAAYTFPTSILVKPDGSPATAILKADLRKGWSDFIASVSIDPFVITAASSVVFTAGTAVYDHSSVRNAPGMPSAFADPVLQQKNSEIAPVTWTGFYLPALTAALPPIIQNLSPGNDSVKIAINNFIVDDYGVTGDVDAINVISLDSGSLAGWVCSIDSISLKFLNSSYKTGGLYGRLILPFSDTTKKSSQINYSCTLSNLSNLTYQFIAEQANSIDFSAWWATLDISNSSITVSNTGGSFLAKADLSGNLSIEGKVMGYQVDFNLIEVEHLVVQSKPEYLSVEKLIAGFNSPERSLSGFPVSITNIAPVVKGSSVGIQFDLDLTLSDQQANGSLPNATTHLDVTANVVSLARRQIWQGVGVSVDTVHVSGGIGCATNIDGWLIFYNDDTVLGSGVKGIVTASFTGIDVGVQVTALFGHTSFNYWYLDGALTFAPVFVAPGLSIRGFGGGAYYNMISTTNSAAISSRDFFKNMAAYQTGAFRPQSGNLGFSAKLIASSNDGYLYSGYAEFGMGFDVSNGFSVSSIDGTVYAEALTQSGDDPNAPIQGIIKLHIGIAEKVYELSGAMQVVYPPGAGTVIQSGVQANGFFDLMVDVGNSNYYLKLGEPELDKRIDINVIELADINAYFMTGNNIAASIPGPDPAIVNVSDLKGYQSIAQTFVPSAGGLVFGAELKLQPPALNYLVFYLSVSAGIGFDVSLARYTEGCAVDSIAPGINGWYALGQVYAALKGEFGLGVDLWFFQGNVKALEVDAGFLLQGGLPSPYWFDGYAFFEFNVLDGQISGSVNFHVKIGDVCIPKQQVFTQPLVAQLRPADGSTDVPLNAEPEADFNYSVQQPFDVILNDNTTHTYRIVINQAQVTNTADNSVYAAWNDNLGDAQFIGGLNKQLVLSPDQALLPQTTYNLSVSVKAQELTDGWQDETYKDTLVQQTISSTFKTGYCHLDSLIAEPNSRLGAFPMPNERYFLPGEATRGAVILDKEYTCASDPTETYDLYARFTVLKSHQVLKVTESKIDQKSLVGTSHYLSYPLPPLPADVLVRVEILKRRTFNKGFLTSLTSGSLAQQTLINRAVATNPSSGLTTTFHTVQSLSAVAARQPAATATAKGTAASNPSGIGYRPDTGAVSFKNGDTSTGMNLAAKTLDVVLYSYHFHTSRYSTLADKMKNVYFDGNAAFGTAQNITLEMKAAEGFDDYDINGFVSTNYSGNHVFFTLPLVDFKENANYNQWSVRYAKPCVYDNFNAANLNVDYARLQDPTASYPQDPTVSYQYLQQVGMTCNNGSCVPLRPIVNNGPGVLLTQQEIVADELPFWATTPFSPTPIANKINQ
ncbi:MAG TPA: hypothetical protein VMH27_03505 [Puia sp.]|nr:hypothetical protein [Puia sp.]